MNDNDMIGEAISYLKDFFTITEISEWIYDNYKIRVSDYAVRKYLKEWCKHHRNGVWYKYKFKKQKRRR